MVGNLERENKSDSPRQFIYQIKEPITRSSHCEGLLKNLVPVYPMYRVLITRASYFGRTAPYRPNLSSMVQASLVPAADIHRRNPNCH